MQKRIFKTLLSVAALLLAALPAEAQKGRGKGGGNKPPPSQADPAIAFVGGGTLHVMNADGTNVTSLGVGVSYGAPAWSPDLDGNPTNGYQGTLAFTRFLNQPIPHIGIWLLDVAVVNGVPQGLNLRQLWNPAVRVAQWQATWAPDLDANAPGYQGALAYVDFEFAAHRLMRFDVVWDGVLTTPSTIHALQDTAIVTGGTITEPAWSFHGDRIAYATGTDLLVLDDLQNPLPRLLASSVDAHFLDWSRTGDDLAFRIYNPINGLYHLWTIDVDNPGPTLAPIVAGHSPSWSPDDSAIVFADTTGPGNRMQILKIDLATAQVTILASHKKRSYGSPAWRPF